MSQMVQLFKFEDAEVRVVMVGGEPWWIAMDVADALGYSDAFEMTKRLDSDEKQNLQIAGFGNRGAAVVNEPGIYEAIIGSQKPTAKRFKKWLKTEVLPSIRKTGGYQQRPMSHLEIVAANAMALVEQERRIAATEQVVADLTHQIERIGESRVWDHCPQNCEPITKIRKRIGAKYGFPAWVVDCVMRELPLSPKVHAMIRNGHESAAGSQYEVWAVADVTRTFARFAAECVRVTACYATHPDIDRQFRMAQQVAA